METLPTQDQHKQPSRFHDQLMAQTEYATKEHPSPYTYRLHKDDTDLVYYGSEHFHDATHPSAQEIREGMDRIRPDLVIIEGLESINPLSLTERKGLADKLSEAEALERYGENVFAAKLAIDRGIDVLSPEPGDTAIVEHLQKQGHSREAIFGEQVALLLKQYDRTTTKPDFEAFLAPYLQRMSTQFGWKDFDFSLDHFRKIHQDVFGIPFGTGDADFYSDTIDPVMRDGKATRATNRVAAARTEFRDQYMIDQVQDLLGKKYKRIFIVFGASHAVIQEPALRKIVEVYERANVRTKP